MKFSSPSFYNLTPPPPPQSRPPAYDMQNYQTPTNSPNGNIPAENYYAATDIIKVSKFAKKLFKILSLQNKSMATYQDQICVGALLLF